MTSGICCDRDTGKYGPLQNKNPGDIYPPGTLDYLDTSVILRVDPPGPYKAIGIRNSFGLAIDPVTGNLWATENGDDDFDEINLIPEKFNSGWRKIMGPATESEISSLPGYEDYVYKDPCSAGRGQLPLPEYHLQNLSRLTCMTTHFLWGTATTAISINLR